MKPYIWNGEMVGPWTCFFGDDSPSETQVIQQSNNPPAYAQPYLTDVLSKAQGLYNQQSALPMYPNSTVVPFSPQTEQALQGIEQRATTGSPLISSAQQNLQGTLAGDYLSAGNPYFSQMADRVRSETLPQIQAGFNAAGRTGSGLASRAAALGVGDALGALAYKNYGDERTRQMQAQAFAPTLASQDYADLGQLAGVGQARETLAADQLQEQINRYYYPTQNLQSSLGNYAALVSGGTVGGQGTQSQPIYQNRTNQLLGTAIGGAGLANMLFNQGGGKGLLSGLF